MLKKAAMLCLPAVVVVLIAGCSKAPVTEQTAAAEQLTAAQQLQAETYAPELWAMVQDTMEAAKAAMTEQDERFSLFRDYDDARALYQRAATLAQQAGTEAQVELTRVREETSDMITDAADEANALAEMLLTFPVTKDTKADIEMLRQDTGVLQSMINESRTEFDRGNYEGAKTKIETVLERISDYKNSVEVARSRVKGRSKA